MITMSDFLITFLVTGLLLFAAMAAVAFVVVRLGFVRMAERISAQIAVQVENAATVAAAGISRGLESQPRVAQAGRATAAAGRKILDFAAARGLGTRSSR